MPFEEERIARKQKQDISDENMVGAALPIVKGIAKGLDVLGEGANLVSQINKRGNLGESGIPERDALQIKALEEAKNKAEEANLGDDPQAKKSFIVDYLKKNFGSDPFMSRQRIDSEIPDWVLLKGRQPQSFSGQAAPQKPAEPEDNVFKIAYNAVSGADAREALQNYRNMDKENRREIEMIKPIQKQIDETIPKVNAAIAAAPKRQAEEIAKLQSITNDYAEIHKKAQALIAAAHQSENRPTRTADHPWLAPLNKVNIPLNPNPKMSDLSPESQERVRKALEPINKTLSSAREMNDYYQEAPKSTYVPKTEEDKKRYGEFVGELKNPPMSAEKMRKNARAIDEAQDEEDIPSEKPKSSLMSPKELQDYMNS